MRFQRLVVEYLSVHAPPLLTLYNSVSRMVITVAGKSVRMWSAVDGTLVHEFKEVTDSVRLNDVM